RGEGEDLHLLGDRALQARMTIADVVDIVAVEIHVAAAGNILDPDAFRLCNRIEARGRDRLMQERRGIAREQSTGGTVERTVLPLATLVGEICIAFRRRNGVRALAG